MASTSSYRPDIDGLRAVAVLSVVVYHLWPKALPGGFLGVDIFFVISGFLITGIIRHELEAGTFSFWTFYARRVRRIYPALLLTIAVTLIAGYFLMLPPDYASLADSARWAAMGAANFFFWAHSGYFAPSADRMPLLHTWSLGVEEQFYLAWPLLLVLGLPLLRRMRLPPIALVLALIVLSLGWALVNLLADPNGVFYSPLTRAWELALGAALVFLPGTASRTVTQLSAVGALVLLGLGGLGIGNFALVGPLLACSGAALLLLPGERPSAVATILSLPPLRFVGAISYSIYLWHWPALALFRHYFMFGKTLNAPDYVAYWIVLLAVSTASWWLVELPFRRWRPAPALPLVIGGVAAVAMVLLGSWLGLDGLASRFPPSLLRYMSVRSLPRSDVALHLFYHDASVSTDGANCFVVSAEAASGQEFTADKCLSNDPGRPDVLVMGDSHSNQFIDALRLTFPEINFSQASASGCYWLLEDYGSSYCTHASTDVYATQLAKYHFDAVILSARWKPGDRLLRLPKTVAYIRDHGALPIILGPSPEYRLDEPSILTYGLLFRRNIAKSLEANKEVISAERHIRKLLAKGPARYFSTYHIVCPKQQCLAITKADEAMLQDENHLSQPGSLWVAQQLRERGLLAELLAGAPLVVTDPQ